jgi:hypothetical protein
VGEFQIPLKQDMPIKVVKMNKTNTWK